MTLPIPTTQKNLVIHAAQWQSPLFFSMIDDVNIFLEILRNVVLDKSIIVVGAPGAESQNLQISVISSIVNSIKLLIYPL